MTLNSFFWSLLTTSMLLTGFNVQQGHAQNCPNVADITFDKHYHNFIFGTKVFDFSVGRLDPEISTELDVTITCSDGSSIQFTNNSLWGVFEPKPVLGCEPEDKSFEATVRCPNTGEVLAEFDLGTYKHYPYLEVWVVPPSCGEGQNGSATLLSVDRTVCAEPVIGQAGISGACDIQRPGRLAYQFLPFPETRQHKSNFNDFRDLITRVCSSDVLGCTDADACNYNASAVCDDGSCVSETSCCPLPLVETFPTAICRGVDFSEICITFEDDISSVDLDKFHITANPNSFSAYQTSRNTATNQICFKAGGDSAASSCGISAVDFTIEYTCFNGTEAKSFTIENVQTYPPPRTFAIFTDYIPTECGDLPQPTHLGIPFSCGNLVIEETKAPVNDCANLASGYINYRFDTGLDLSNAPSMLKDVLSGTINVPPCEEDCPCDKTLCGKNCGNNSNSNSLSVNLIDVNFPAVLCGLYADELSFEITGAEASYLGYYVRLIYNGETVAFTANDTKYSATTFTKEIRFNQYGCEPIIGLFEWEIVCNKDNWDDDDVIVAAGTFGTITAYPYYKNFVPRISEDRFCDNSQLLGRLFCGDIAIVTELVDNPNIACGRGSENKVLQWSVNPGFDTTDAPACFDVSALSGTLTCYGEEIECPCVCDTTDEPVCGIDGNTYINACEAGCAKVEVAYDGTCNTSNRGLFEDNNWLKRYNTDNVCEDGMTIREYEYSGDFTFIHVQAPNGKGDLFLNNGTHYCTDAPGHSCLDSYNLSKIMNTWTCDMDAVQTEESEENNEAETPEETESEEEIETVEETETTVAVNTAMFTNYAWLGSIVNQNDCSSSTKITEYTMGSHNFIYVENKNGGSLYYKDGTFYCSDAPGYSCLSLYSFESPLSVWQCDKEGVECDASSSKVCGTDGKSYNNECDALNAGTSIAAYEACANPNPVETPFENYSWIKEMVDASNCESNTSISEFSFGSYSFIYINLEGKGMLYLNNGTFYCSDMPGYSCQTAYNLTEPSKQWNCEGKVTFKNAENQNNQKLMPTANFTIFPNPANGQFNAAISEPTKTESMITIFDLHGKIVSSQKLAIDKQIAVFNLEDRAKGMYMIQLQAGSYIKTQKLILR